LKGRCIICNAKGVADAYYCKECVMLEKDRDGCPRVVNIGISRTDKYYERKKYEINENFN
jgi:PHD finger-like domain-containing protein 5A